MIVVGGRYNLISDAYQCSKLIAIVKHEESINDAFAFAFETTRNIGDYGRIFGQVCESVRADHLFSVQIYAGAANAR
ncbi:hypothetical protein [Methanoculleus oceani]|nr:hypothetical protein [Methanoculleus sp. CWC-02]